MRRTNTQPLKEVLQEYIDAMKMRGKLREVNLISHWENQVGRTIAAATIDIYVRDNKLYVRLNSSVIRNELLLVKDRLKDKLNQLAGSEVITEIVLR